MHRLPIAIAIAAALVPSVGHADVGASVGEDAEPVFSCKPSAARVHVSFKDEVTLGELVTWIMGLSCENFVYGTRVQAASKVVIVTPREMSPDDAWKTFLAALRAMRLTIVRKAGNYEIIEAPQAKRQAVAIVAPKNVPAGDRFQRAVFRPRHASLVEIERAFAALVSEDGEVVALDSSGALLVSDYGTHIARMSSLLDDLDQARADQQVYVIRVEHGDVVQIASSLEAIIGTDIARPGPAAPRGDSKATTTAATPSSAAPAKILTDERTRSILIVGTDAVYQRAHALVRQLDVALDEEASNHIHMVMLEHASAEQLATTLQSLIDNRPRDNKPSERVARPEPAVAQTVEGDVRITFDKASNALLVMASTRDYLVLREVIRRLDNSRTQVFIEATILDISVEGDRALRGAFHGGTLHDGALWLAGLQYDDLRTMQLAGGLGDANTADTNPGLGLEGLLAGVIGEPTTFLGMTIPSFAILFQALATSRNANVLSAPGVTTVDNQEAVISVGQVVPAIAGLTALGANVVTQNVQPVDVSLTLKVTPHVNSQDEIQLDIDLNIENIIAIDPKLGPTTSKRTVTNTVVVGDQESIIIGGLMSDEMVDIETKVPLLGDIPVLGALFRRTLSAKKKRNLLILLTPYIVNDRASSNALMREKLREREEFARAFTVLRTVDYQPKVDYSRKRGVVEEINRAAIDIAAERRLLDEMAAKPSPLPSGRIWPPEPELATPTSEDLRTPNGSGKSGPHP